MSTFCLNSDPNIWEPRSTSQGTVEILCVMPFKATGQVDMIRPTIKIESGRNGDAPDSVWSFSLVDHYGGLKSSFKFENNGTQEELKEFFELCARIAGFTWIGRVELLRNDESVTKQGETNENQFSNQGTHDERPDEEERVAGV